MMRSSPWNHLCRLSTAWCPAAHTCPRGPSSWSPSRRRTRGRALLCPAGGKVCGGHGGGKDGLLLPNGKARAIRGGRHEKLASKGFGRGWGTRRLAGSQGFWGHGVQRGTPTPCPGGATTHKQHLEKEPAWLRSCLGSTGASGEACLWGRLVTLPGTRLPPTPWKHGSPGTKLFGKAFG